jgi:hypothetical protein
MSLSDEEKRLIGASDLPALLGLSPWSGPVALWARVVHGWEAATTRDMEAGNAAEAYNRSLYRQETGYTLAGPAKWRHPLYPWLRCSPDDTATDTPDGRRGVELKRYNYLEGWGSPGTDAVPADIWVQVQFQGGVALDLGEWDTGGVDVSGLLRGELRIYHVPHAAEVYERCIAAVERFWRDFVVPQRCPDGDNLILLERDAEALKALFPVPKTETPLAWGALTPAQQETARRWLEANAARRAWKKQEDALRAKVQHMLREVPALLLPEGMSARRVCFGEQDGKPSLDVAGLRAALADEDPGVRRRVEALLAKFTTQETTRPLVAR